MTNVSITKKTVTVREITEEGRDTKYHIKTEYGGEIYLSPEEFEIVYNIKDAFEVL